MNDDELKEWARAHDQQLGDGQRVIEATMRSIRSDQSKPTISWRILAPLAATAAAVAIGGLIWNPGAPPPEPPVSFEPKRAVLELDRYASLFSDS